MLSPGQPIPPSTSEIAAGWRAACVAYRRVRQTGQLHGPAFQEALLALRAVRPELKEREAAEQTTRRDLLRVLRSSRLALERSW